MKRELKEKSGIYEIEIKDTEEIINSLLKENYEVSVEKDYSKNIISNFDVHKVSGKFFKTKLFMASGVKNYVGDMMIISIKNKNHEDYKKIKNIIEKHLVMEKL